MQQNYLYQLYLISGCALMHYLFGWLFGLLLVTLFSGFVFEQYATLKTAILGGLINSVAIAYTYVKFPGETARLLEVIGALLGDLTPEFILIISILIPTSTYALAGFFSSNLATIKRKISA